jgi:hypothetical protein
VAELLQSHTARVSFAAPIAAAADITTTIVNVKPSRIGSVRALLDIYDHCEQAAVRMYGGGMGERDVARGQIELLASLFHPDSTMTSRPRPTTRPIWRRDCRRAPGARARRGSAGARGSARNATVVARDGPKQGVGHGREGDAVPARAATASTQRRQLQPQGSRVGDPMQDPDAPHRGVAGLNIGPSGGAVIAVGTAQTIPAATSRSPALPAGEVEQEAADPGPDRRCRQRRMKRVPHPSAP